MCGIVGGCWNLPPNNLDDRLGRALYEMRFRGPDDKGVDVYLNGGQTFALGHTRLSIIDLSYAGHQPIVSSDLRFEMVFNGEIYNYRELRSELLGLGCKFHSDSDTEVLLAAWIRWGYDCLNRLEGMFAFVIHDKKDNIIHCARDAFGIKPLFYSRNTNAFIFASTLPTLQYLLNEKCSLDWQRCYDYLVHGDYDSNERTFFDGVWRLQPGHYFSFDPRNSLDIKPKPWWKPEIREIPGLKFAEAVELVREQFLSNVRLHLRSDVTLGAALSGGIDSSALVCAMRHLEPGAVIKTFSYIAPGESLSEEVWVDRVNSYINAESYKTTAGSEDLICDLDDMIITQGEPFLSTSIYAQYRVFQLAKEHGVTVTLDGQGADELLAGYSGYPGYRLNSLLERGDLFSAHHFAKNWSKWPGRSYTQAMMEFGRNTLPDSLYVSARKILGRDFQPKWLNVGLMADHGIIFRELRLTRDPSNKGRRVMEQLARSIQGRGLPALLRHADRNSMRFSVESRVPFLTTGMANLLLSMPESYLISDLGETKYIFRAAMRGIVPDIILDRRDKIGFSTPERTWLLGASGVLRKIVEEGAADIPFINKDLLLDAFDKIVSGKSPFSMQLWRWVNFIRWKQLCSVG